MRVFVAVLAGLLLTTVSTAEAKKHRRKAAQKHAAAKRTQERERPKRAQHRQEERRIAIRERAIEEEVEEVEEADQDQQPEPERPRRREIDDDDVRPRRARAWVPQSVGAPWDGELENASRLRLLDGVLIRRPGRAFGTRTTVDFVRQAVNDTLEQVAPTHDLAIGDLSAEHGGPISEHHSHQSGRDADIGLFYRQAPRGYPDSFARATEDNLDCAATFALIANFVRTANQDGGVQVIFLDYKVQGILYRWAIEHDISENRLERMFEYPNGKGSGGIVRHYAGHDNHMHVRFRCASSDDDCH
jgi:hypothetical protein